MKVANLIAVTLTAVFCWGCPSSPQQPTSDVTVVDTVDAVEDAPIIRPTGTFKTNTGFRGFNMVDGFPVSNSYYPTPELASIRDAVVVTPQTVDILNDSRYFQYVLVPGDYGHFTLRREGQPGKRVVITADPSLDLPWKTDMTVRFNSINVFGNHILINGIEIDGEDRNEKDQVNRIVAPDRSDYATDVIFQNCHIHNMIGYGLKFFGEYCAVQDCVVNDKGPGGFDQGGVGFYTITGKPAWGNRVVGSEIFNWSDQIGVPVTYKDGGTDGDLVPDLLIENCDLYITPDLYVESEFGITACAEDGVDFKTGGTENNPAIMRNCRIWGTRVTDQSCGGSGSSGKAATLHLDARNWIFENVIVFDCNEGFYVTDESKPGTKVYGIHIENCLLFNLQQTYPYEVRQGKIVYEDGKPKENIYSGSAFRISGDAVVVNTTTVDVVRWNSKRGESLAKFDENILCDKEGCLDKFVNFRFAIKRLTGPEWVSVRVPIDR